MVKEVDSNRVYVRALHPLGYSRIGSNPVAIEKEKREEPTILQERGVRREGWGEGDAESLCVC